MLRTTIISAVCGLMLCGCQQSSQDSSSTATSTASTAAEQSAPVATSGNNANTQSATFVPFDTTPIGIESCDAFIAEANKCFANSKQHPSTPVILRPGYENQFRQWRQMKDSPNYASSLKAVCDQQMDVGVKALKDGLLCD